MRARDRDSRSTSGVFQRESPRARGSSPTARRCPVALRRSVCAALRPRQAARVRSPPSVLHANDLRQAGHSVTSGLAGDRRRFERARRTSQREHAPRVRDRRAPATALLPPSAPRDEPRHVLSPFGPIEQRQQRALRIRRRPETISHHSASVRSVENPIVVPWKFRRERRIDAPALRDARVASGHRFDRASGCRASRSPPRSATDSGRWLMLSSMRGTAAS